MREQEGRMGWRPCGGGSSSSSSSSTTAPPVLSSSNPATACYLCPDACPACRVVQVHKQPGETPKVRDLGKEWEVKEAKLG